MSEIITIPSCRSPFVVDVNGEIYSYPAGETVEVPDEVAAVIKHHVDMQPVPVPPVSYESMLAGVIDHTIEHLVTPSGCDYVGTLSQLINLKSLVIENGATSISPYACSDMVTLENVKIAGSVKSIGMSAFSRCTSLHTVEMENGIEEIGNQMCNGCRALQNVVIPETVKYIRSTAFAIEGLLTVIFKGKPENIAVGPPAFSSSTITDIYVPWPEGEVSGAPWGASNATIHYNHKEG